MRDTIQINEAALRKLRIRTSYQTALNAYRMRKGLARISWATWLITAGTILLWCITATAMARAAGAHDIRAVLMNIASNAIDVHDNDALTTTLIAYGAKDNTLMLQGQYWRFITPIFLHANALHIGLNMLNLVVLGVFLERLFGHLRFLLIYLLTGVISIIASFYFAPQEISVGASGAIFGLVGAYSIFVLVHRRAFPRGGIPALFWLLIIVTLNLGLGFFVSNVDNYAHIGGLLSGCLLGWEFTPLYRLSSNNVLVDKHGLTRRWPLALLTIAGTLVLAFLALHFI
ncbi:MAG: rhomboid family intramembrane serine protease [Ktedonobacteraceae bacterium]|nr:rhomboid family intramembrane serine protease [Ktedonobacteraceae bacterium]